MASVVTEYIKAHQVVFIDYEYAVVEHNETVGVGTNAFEPMIENIINENSTNVDTISGSTITSKNIINAVNDALEQAKIINN